METSTARVLLKVTRDPALRWYRAAAEQGFGPAQVNLGLMYGQGKGVPQDFAQAYAWCNVAAVSGAENAVACRDLFGKRLSADDLASAQRKAGELHERIAGAASPEG